MKKVTVETMADAARLALLASPDTSEISDPQPVLGGHMDGDQWVQESRPVTLGGVPLVRVITDSRVVSPVTGAVRHEPLGVDFPSASVPTRSEFLGMAEDELNLGGAR